MTNQDFIVFFPESSLSIDDIWPGKDAPDEPEPYRSRCRKARRETMNTICISMSRSAWITTLRKALVEAENSSPLYEVVVHGVTTDAPSRPVEIRFDNEDMDNQDYLPEGTCYVHQFDS